MVGAWGGPVLLKGVMTAEDARRAVDSAAPASPSPTTADGRPTAVPGALDVLDEVVDEVGDEIDVLLDGGVRRGTDVVKALALGATGLPGRPAVALRARRGRRRRAWSGSWRSSGTRSTARSR